MSSHFIGASAFTSPSREAARAPLRRCHEPSTRGAAHDGMEDDLEIKPLGAGCEVGRSCVLMSFKGYKILFDCGVHPAHTGLASLPYFDDIDPSEIDLLLVTHFHMDHCGAVPYFTEKTGFRGRVFMTHATKAIYKILMHDAARLDRNDDKLFDEQDMLKSMEKIELLDYHQHLQHKGIKFWCYNAGHVLGACMFMVEVAGEAQGQGEG